MGAGSSNRAQRAAEEREREREAAIAAGTANVNRIFDAPSREKQRADFATALREKYRTDLDRQKGMADRRRIFSLARSGLSGGSADVDSRRTLGEEYTQGILNAEDRTQGALGDLAAQDEASRLQLLSMVQGGLDATTAAARAGSAMQANAQNIKGNALQQGLGDMFGATADIYRRSEEAAQRRRGAKDAQGTIYGRPFAGG